MRKAKEISDQMKVIRYKHLQEVTYVWLTYTNAQIVPKIKSQRDGKSSQSMSVIARNAKKIIEYIEKGFDNIQVDVSYIGYIIPSPIGMPRFGSQVTVNNITHPEEIDKTIEPDTTGKIANYYHNHLIKAAGVVNFVDHFFSNTADENLPSQYKILQTVCNNTKNSLGKNARLMQKIFANFKQSI